MPIMTKKEMANAEYLHIDENAVFSITQSEYDIIERERMRIAKVRQEKKKKREKRIAMQIRFAKKANEKYRAKRNRRNKIAKKSRRN